ncbi:hypothetical protein [Desulfotomaculum defluvii]
MEIVKLLCSIFRYCYCFETKKAFVLIYDCRDNCYRFFVSD